MVELTAGEASYLAMHAIYEANNARDPRYNQDLSMEEREAKWDRWHKIAQALYPGNPWMARPADWSPTVVSRG